MLKPLTAEGIACFRIHVSCIAVRLATCFLQIQEYASVIRHTPWCHVLALAAIIKQVSLLCKRFHKSCVCPSSVKILHNILK